MYRDVVIYNSNGDQLVTRLEINNSLPIFNVPEIIENNHAYEINDITNSDPNNKIKLLETSTDLQYIAHIKNPYTDILSALYYDPDNKELLLLTHPDYYILKGSRSNDSYVQAYCIGVFKESSFADTLSYQYEHTDIEFGTITKPDKYSTLLLNMHGIATRKRFRYRANNVNAIYRELNIIPFMKLNRKDVFGDINLPSYIFVPIGSYRFRAKYIGYDNPDYIYIPLVI